MRGLRPLPLTPTLSIVDDIDETLPLADPPSQEETTHFSIMDAEGNAVSMTQSIELVYGAKVAADGLGFLYNNYMSALEDEDPSHPYYLRPNAVPWSSAAPSIVFRRSQPWLVTGSPGSERIFSTVGQFLSNVIDRSQTIREAMEEPRLHCSIGGQISLEQERFDPAVPSYLSELGYTLLPREPSPSTSAASRQSSGDSRLTGSRASPTFAAMAPQPAPRRDAAPAHLRPARRRRRPRRGRGPRRDQ